MHEWKTGSQDRSFFKLQIPWTSKEYVRLNRKIQESGVINRSACVRQMTLDSYIVKLDLVGIHEMIRLPRNENDTINHMAKLANTTGSIYEADISDM